MELKYKTDLDKMSVKDGINRTFMELKSFSLNWHSKSY